MKIKFKKKFAILLTSVVCLLLTSFSAFADGLVKVVPADTTISTSKQITIKINISNINNLYAFAADINYVPGVLKPVSVTKGTALSMNGTVNTFFQYSINKKDGKIIIGLTQEANIGTNITHPETAVIIKFESINSGYCPITLSNVGLLAPNAKTKYAATLSKGTVTVKAVNAKPVNVFFSPSNHGTIIPATFNVAIKTGPVRNLYGFATEINYNPNIIELLEVKEGNFLSQGDSIPTIFMKKIDNKNGHCIIGITRSSSPPSGISSGRDTTIAWLKFKTVGPGTSELKFSNTGLIAPNGITHYQVVTINGKVVTTLNPNHVVVSFNPDKLSVHEGETKHCMITLDNVSNLYGFAADLHFNPKLVKVTSLKEGPFLNRQGNDQTSFVYRIDSVSGKVVIGITRLGDTTGVSAFANAELCTINFEGKAHGNDSLYLRNVGLIAPNGTTEYPYLAQSAALSVIPKSGGVIKGVVTDSKTGLPIEGVTVYATGGLYATNKTNSRGEFTINNVPFGLHYHVYAYGNHYANKEISGINVQQKKNQSEVTVVKLNIKMDFVPDAFKIITIHPNPNPDTSFIGKGGTLHRYYIIYNKTTGKPSGGVPVKVHSKNFNRTYFSDGQGIVDVAIRSADIGSGTDGSNENYTITQLNGENLSSPITFICEVYNPIYKKNWDNREYEKLAISFVSAKKSRGSSVELIDNNGDISEGEVLNITRQARGDAGVEFTAGAEAGVKIFGPIEAKAGAEAGVGGNIAVVSEDYYSFPANINGGSDAIAKYILIADGNFNSLDNTLIHLLTLFEQNYDQSTLTNAYIGDRKGLDIGVGANASAEAGVGGNERNGVWIGIGAGANIGANSHVNLDLYTYPQENLNEYSFAVTGNLSANASAGLFLKRKSDYNKDKDDELKAQLHLLDYSGTRGLRFSIVKNKSTNAIEEFKLSFIHRKGHSGYEEIITYYIDGQDVFDRMNATVQEVASLNNMNSGNSNIFVSNTLFSKITNSLFSIIYDIQDNNGAANVYYEKHISQLTDAKSFDLKLGVSLTSVLRAKFGGGKTMEGGKSKLIEKGYWIKGKHLVMEKYDNTIPEIETEYSEILQEIIDNVPFSIRFKVGVVNLLERINPFSKSAATEDDFYIGDAGSYLEITMDDVPLDVDSISCTSWSWYGGAPSLKASSLSAPRLKVAKILKSKAEQSFGMRYGVGGFYQLEPLNTNLLDTCYLTLTYADEDIVGYDESSLKIFLEDKENHSWICVGGVVNLDSNFVRAPITKLGLYTIAPVMPSGTININSANDSTIITPNVTTEFTTDIIYNNDSSIIANDEMITTNLTSGSIVETDLDTTLAGTQLHPVDGIITFHVKPDSTSNVVKISAFSTNGSATGSTFHTFYDNVIPETPKFLSYDVDNESVKLNWNHVTDKDLSGYILYFDFDTLEPYKGYGVILGDTSPVILGADTSYTVSGLLNDSTYYFWVSAYDIYGNESKLSNRFKVTVIPKPVINDTSVCDCNDSIILKAKGQNIIWYSDSLLTDTIAQGDSITVHFANPKKYTYWLTQQINGVTSSAKKVALFVHGTYHLTVDTTICRGESYFAGGKLQSKSGIYYDSLFSQFGCDSIVTSKLSIDSLPDITLGKDTTLCHSNSITLDPGVFQSYLWNTGSVSKTLTVDSAGQFYVTVTDSIGCQTTSKAINISYYAKQEKPVIGQGDTVVDLNKKTSSSYTSTATQQNLNYLWNITPDNAYDKIVPENNKLTINWNVSFRGKAFISVGIFKQCDTVFSDTVVVRVFSTVGIQNQKIAKYIQIYPNPAYNELTIENTSQTKCESISIYNIQSHLLNRIPFHQKKIEINISDFANGIYLIKIKTMQGLVVKKFVKE